MSEENTQPIRNVIELEVGDMPVEELKEILESLREQIKQNRIANQTIELSEHSIQILNTQELTSKHIVFVTVDTGTLPPDKAKQQIANIVQQFKEVVAPAQVMGLEKRIKFKVMEIPDQVGG